MFGAGFFFRLIPKSISWSAVNIPTNVFWRHMMGQYTILFFIKKRGVRGRPGTFLSLQLSFLGISLCEVFFKNSIVVYLGGLLFHQ